MQNDRETFAQRQARVRDQDAADAEAMARANVLREARSKAQAERQAQADAEAKVKANALHQDRAKAGPAGGTGSAY
jgi:hypothetical protein